MSLQSSEAFGGFLHGSSGPAQGHGRRTPALHVPADTPYRGHHILDNVGTGERAPKLLRQTQPRDGEDLIDTFQDRAGDPGPVWFETPGEVADQLFGFIGIVQLPCLSPRRTCSELV